MFNFEPGVWYKIPHYNGYEVSKRANTDGTYAYQVRSFKNVKKYPNGYILTYDHYDKAGNPHYYYTMTRYDNNVFRLTIMDILDLIEKEPYYAVESNGPNLSSRNLTLPKQRLYNKNKQGTAEERNSFSDLMKKSPLMKEVFIREDK